MKAIKGIPLFGDIRFRVLAFNLLALTLLTSCGSSGSSDSSNPAVQDNIEGRIFVLGAQVDGFGNLVMYVNGTDPDGEVLTVADLQAARVTVDGVSYDRNDDPELTINAVVDGDKVLSLGTLTDYSSSTGVEVQIVADSLIQMLDSLPLVYEVQVMTFSDGLETQLAWTEDLAAVKVAVQAEHTVRNKTALYDSMGVALEGDAGTEGLVERCRPAHILVVFTDGDDNASSTYTDTGINAIVNNDRAVVIMLGTGKAQTDVLKTLAGDFGAVVQVTDPGALVAEVDKWSSSLSNMVRITLDSSINTTGKTVRITVGSQSVKVSPNSHCTLPR